MSEIDDRIQELANPQAEQGLVIRDNATLEEQRGWAMLEYRLAGKTDAEIALRFGIGLSEIDDLIRTAVNDSVATRDHSQVTAFMVAGLLRLDQELAELNRQLPIEGTRWHEEVVRGSAKEGDRVTKLKEQICNIPEKRKLIDSRRATSIALKTILASNTGERANVIPKDEMSEIMGVLKDVATEGIGELGRQLTEQAQQVGRLEERKSLEVDYDSISRDSDAEKPGSDPVQ